MSVGLSNFSVQFPSRTAGGELVPPFECPVRVEYVLEQLQSVKLGEVIAPKEYSLDPIKRIHDAGFLSFLEECWDAWAASGYKGEAIPTVWPSRRLTQQRIPDHIEDI